MLIFILFLGCRKKQYGFKIGVKSRRNLLKGALGVGVVGGVLPSSWVKPVVNSVVLPAHAQTSGSVSDASQSERCVSTTSLSVTIDSVTPTTGTLNPNQGDTIEVELSYSVTNPPSVFEARLTVSLTFDHSPNLGFSVFKTVTNTSGTETMVIPYNALGSIEDNGGAHTSSIQAQFAGNDECHSPPVMIVPGGEDSVPVDITFNSL